VNDILLGARRPTARAPAIFEITSGIAAPPASPSPGLPKPTWARGDIERRGNGIPLALSNLSTAEQTVETMSGVSFTDYLATVAAGVAMRFQPPTPPTPPGRVTLPGKSLRSGISGVSLDTEAAELMAFQQSYSATAQVFSVVNEMLDTLMGIVN